MEVPSQDRRAGGKVAWRVCHAVLAAVLFPPLVIFLVAQGFFSAKTTEIAENFGGEYGTCILFASEKNDVLHLSSWKVCAFAEVVLAFIAMVLAVIALIKAAYVVGISP